MQVKQDEIVFRPVTIVIESGAELAELLRVTERTVYAVPYAGKATAEFAAALRKALTDVSTPKQGMK